MRVVANAGALSAAAKVAASAVESKKGIPILSALLVDATDTVPSPAPISTSR
jgi:DNA polymerase III sliding clamp (beta) subunit (PCNA family)